MPVTIHFLGRTIPVQFMMTVSNLPTIIWDEPPPINLKAAFRVQIAASIVDVECTLDHYDRSKQVLLYIRAHDLAQTAINLMSFATGAAQTLIMDEFIDENGNRGPLLFIDRR
jgi:hypothetical protein